MPTGCIFFDYLFSRTGGCHYLNKTRAGCFIFAMAGSCFDFFFYAPSCYCWNLPELELAFACYVAFEKKRGPDSEGEILWMYLLYDDYNAGHSEQPLKTKHPPEAVMLGTILLEKATSPTSRASHDVAWPVSLIPTGLKSKMYAINLGC